MRKQKKPVRDVVLTFRVTSDENQAVRKKCADNGVSLTEMLRAISMRVVSGDIEL